MAMNQADHPDDAKEEKKNSSGTPDSSKSAQTPDSLTHKTAGVTITVSVKEEGKKEDDQNKSDDDKKDKNEKPPFYRRPRVIVIASIIIAVVVIVIVILWLILRQYVSTDDAYIDGNVTQISPRVAAQVTALHIDDNELVHPGDLMIELDPTDYLLALDEAKAQVASSQAKLTQARAQIQTATASVAQAGPGLMRRKCSSTTPPATSRATTAWTNARVHASSWTTPRPLKKTRRPNSKRPEPV